jgi:sugar phosphate isomerase/epimerase
MIFVASACSEKKSIVAAVEEIAQMGFQNIELTGGTSYEPHYLPDLIHLREKYKLNYRVHNYFPPPEKHFVLNLASDREDVLSKSKQLVREALRISNQFNAKVYGLHAGFRISPQPSELGQQIRNKNIQPYELALNNFKNCFLELEQEALRQGVTLLLENNVFSQANFESFDGNNPFFLTTSEDYFQMKEQFSFELLLDVAHLKVSCQTLKKDFRRELEILLKESNYIHVSDNNGRSDSNNEFQEDSVFYNVFKQTDLSNKTFTIEVYDGLESVKRCQRLLENLL